MVNRKRINFAKEHQLLKQGYVLHNDKKMYISIYQGWNGFVVRRDKHTVDEHLDKLQGTLSSGTVEHMQGNTPKLDYLFNIGLICL